MAKMPDMLEKCSWKLDEANLSDLWWKVSCRIGNFITRFSPEDITYCPFCGKEIVCSEAEKGHKWTHSYDCPAGFSDQPCDCGEPI